MNRPQGTALSVRTTISPVSPTGAGVPSGRTMSTSYKGLGMPIEPVLGTVPTGLYTVRVVSVWPKPSISVRPVARFHCSNTSGFNASPAVVEYSMEDKSYLLKSSLIKNRYMVGGAQKVVMWYFANMGKMSWASNLSKS